ncbi:hypothetical protein [Epilithonimonas vandammei]|uniref:hypothetical protein n=1 Tax=Epilithonimonas vandammei TaxID=2487072 RepID=UPI00289EDB4B|nr:hypothetical protein [Epilithonimonas vandammei]
MKNILLSTIVLVGLCAISNAQSLDTTFGTNGTITHTGIGNYFYATELPDGSVILSGDYETSSVSKAVVTKLKPDGSLDTSFGSGGKYVIDQFSDVDYYETFSKAILQPDGKLVLLYGAEYDNGIDEETISVRMMRLNSNGSVDNSFLGYSVQNVGEDNYPYGIFRLQSGKILMYGENYIMRFNENGTLDTSYANNGTRTIAFDINELNIIGSAIYLENYTQKTLVRLADESSSNTKIYNLPQNSSYYFRGNNIYIHKYLNFSEITKLDFNFDPVSTYGNNGTAIFTEYLGYDFVFQSQGSILSSDSIPNYDQNGNILSVDMAYRRINPNGTMDSTFGTAGVYKINIPENAPYNYYSYDYIHSNGKLYHLFYDKDWENNNIYLKRSNLPNEILATENATVIKEIRIIQNPVRENLILSGNLRNAKIYDMTGKETGISFEGKQTSVERLKTGAYIINAVSDSGKKINLKFIKK